VLAAFLWERRSFETREAETVVMVACSPASARRRVVRGALAATVVAVPMMLVGWSFWRPADVLRWSDAVAERTLLTETSWHQP
jgi:hypothetical protein